MAENIQEIFFMTTPDMSRFIYVSPAYEEIWGQPREKLYRDATSWVNQIHPEDRKRVAESFEKSRSQGKQFYEEFLIVKPDGSSRWIMAKGFPIFNENGEMYRYAGTAADITERKQAEVKLAQAREQEIEIGSQIQRAVLLSQPDENIPGLSIDAFTIASERIDGDFYDFFSFNDNCLDMLIGDVMGKGIPAALLGAAVKSSFLESKVKLIMSSTKGTPPEPADIVSQVHSHIAGKLVELSSFVTLHYVRIDLDQNRLDFVDCGHTSIIHFSNRTNTCWMLKGNSVPIGFSENEIYEQYSLPIEENDVFFFYSDGITEAKNTKGDLFGEDRLIRLIAINSGSEPTELIEEVKNSVVEFSQSDKFADDLTCVAVKIQKRTNNPLIKLTESIFKSDLDHLASMRDFVQDALEESLSGKLTDEDVAKVILAAHEAATNIIKHAHKNRGEESIRFEVGIYSAWFFIRLTYKSDLFDWGHWRMPFSAGMGEGGYGMYIMSQVMDSVLYTNDDSGQCCVCLVKRLENL